MADLAQSLSEIKSLPDHVLQKELSSPSGMLPGFLVLSELHDRKNLRGGMTSGDDTKPKTLAQEYAGSFGQNIRQQPPFVPRPQQPPQQPPMQPPPMRGQGGLAGLPQPQQPYAYGGLVSLAGGGRINMRDYIIQSAIKHGIDPNVALQVAMNEGGPQSMTDITRQSVVMQPYGQEESYGPFQLHIRGGLGARALKAGIDPRDPDDAYRAVDFALAEAKNRGWGQWYGWKGDPWAGIKEHGGAAYPTGDSEVDTAAMGTDIAETAGNTAAAMTAAENTETVSPISDYFMAAKMFEQPEAQPPPPLQSMQRQAQPYDPRIVEEFSETPDYYRRRRAAYG